MTRIMYLQELEARLSNRMSAQELVRILNYYEDYFSEAGPSREGEVMDELGTPAELTRKIMGEEVTREAEEEYVAASAPKAYREKRHWGLGSVWKVILAICAAPIAIPIMAALVVVALALVISVFAVVISLGVAGLAAVAMGVISVVAGFGALLTHGMATTMYFAGGGMLAAGVGCAIMAGAVALGGLCCRGIVCLFGGLLHRRGAQA